MLLRVCGSDQTHVLEPATKPLPPYLFAHRPPTPVGSDLLRIQILWNESSMMMANEFYCTFHASQCDNETHEREAIV